MGDSLLKNCYNQGNVEGTFPGGIVGYVYTSASIANCYNTGKIENIIEGGTSAGIVSNGVRFGDLNKDNLYYLEGSATIFERTNKKDPNTKEYMQSQEFVNELNKYIDENPIEGITLLKWKYNEGNYPTFE